MNLSSKLNHKTMIKRHHIRNEQVQLFYCKRIGLNKKYYKTVKKFVLVVFLNLIRPYLSNEKIYYRLSTCVDGTLDYNIEHNNDSVVGRRRKIVKLFLLPALMVILTKLPL